MLAGTPTHPVETEQNNLKQTADVLVAGTAGFTGSVCPLGDLDVFAVDVAAAGSSLVVGLDLDGSGACLGAQALVTVKTAGGAALGSGTGSCVDLTAQSDAGLGNVPAGTYYVYVEAQSLATLGLYTLSVASIAPGCGDGVLQLSEQCDDGNTVAGDGCGATCIIETVCGDGIIGAAEQCDDGNLAPGDGCDAGCLFEGSFCAEVEANDVVAQANLLTGCDGAAASIGVVGDKDFFAVEVLIAGSSLRAETSDGASGCPTGFDSVLRFYGTNGVELVSDDQDGVDSCSLLAPATDPQVTNLQPGTYYLSVEDWLNNDTQGSYVLEVKVTAPGCGDGILQAPEECDDGDLVPGDGCDAVCKFEGVLCAEAEANGALATANAASGCDVVSGAISPIADADFFKVDVVVAGSSLRAEVVDPTGGCPVGFDSHLYLYNSAGVELLNDDDDGVDQCSLINPAVDVAATNLAVGTYYVSVREHLDDELQPLYYLKLKVSPPGCGDGIQQGPEECDDGNQIDGDYCSNACLLSAATLEAEPNGAIGQATPLGAGDLAFEAALVPVADVDYFAITVAAGADLILETSDGGNPTACSSDTVITLYNAAGMQLATDDDDSPNGACSLLTGVNGDAVTNLAAGTYYVKVEEFGNNSTIPSYRLNVQILP